MMSIVQKEKIINSYSRVLIEIIEECNVSFEDFCILKSAFLEINKNNIININPLTIKKYKELVMNIKSNVNFQDKMQNFIFSLISRKYINLIKDIFLSAEKQLKGVFSICNVMVYSKNELSSQIKQKIEENIRNNSIFRTTNIVYNISNSINSDNIEIISNGKICVLSIEQYIKSLLML